MATTDKFSEQQSGFGFARCGIPYRRFSMNKLTTPGGNRLHNVFGDVEKVFNHFFDQTDESSSIRFQPNWNLVEGVDQFQLSIELPGISREDIHLEVEDCILTVSGEKTIASLAEGESLHVSGRASGNFRRRIEFNSPVDLDKIEALLTDGLLIVRVPKSEKVVPRKIKIQSN